MAHHCAGVARLPARVQPLAPATWQRHSCLPGRPASRVPRYRLRHYGAAGRVRRGRDTREPEAHLRYTGRLVREFYSVHPRPRAQAARQAREEHQGPVHQPELWRQVC